MLPILWKPFETMFDTTPRLPHWVDQFFDFDDQIYTPMDMVEDENSYNIKVDLPGITKQDISVTLKDDILTVQGEKKIEKENKKDRFYRSERSYGSFSRSVSIPSSIDYLKVKAHFENGVLEITLPKTENSKPRKIKIDSN